MKLSGHFDLSNERPRRRDQDRRWGRIYRRRTGAPRRGVAIFLGCSYTAARENRIFMLTRTRPWDSPKLVRVAVGYLWTAVNKALQPGYGARAKLRGDK